MLSLEVSLPLQGRPAGGRLRRPSSAGYPTSLLSDEQGDDMTIVRLLGWAIIVLALFAYVVIALARFSEGWDFAFALVLLGVALTLPDLLNKNIPTAWRVRTLIRLLFWSVAVYAGYTQTTTVFIAIGGASLVVGALSIPELRDRKQPIALRARSLAWMLWWAAYGISNLLATIEDWNPPIQVFLLTFLGILLALIGTSLSEALARRRYEQRVSLVSELRTNVIGLETTQSEIQAKQRIAQLKEDIEKFEDLAQQAKSAASVALLVQEEFRRGERRSFWTGFAMNLIFFLLGVGASFLTAPST